MRRRTRHGHGTDGRRLVVIAAFEERQTPSVHREGATARQAETREEIVIIRRRRRRRIGRRTERPATPASYRKQQAAAQGVRGSEDQVRDDSMRRLPDDVPLPGRLLETQGRSAQHGRRRKRRRTGRGASDPTHRGALPM